MMRKIIIEVEEEILSLKDHEQIVIHIGDRKFVVQPATEDDLDKINKGIICMD
ncbi:MULTISPECIES: hypothetical protein [Paenibacillus]|uniref:hypothetical protein n=1 Tax=Paenibacillus TaxID=44249 RepID=UPI0022B869C2|nr:hypothetical protein [Paenibacillus caseinilyticus]MCZ8520152.1 hypothetical protein [Paenibacillus caseinilyticus]